MNLFPCLIAILSLSCNCHHKATSASNGQSNMSATYDSSVATTSVGRIPACVQRRIDSLKQLRVWNPPAQVDEYVYDGKQVYLFSADCCDQFPLLVDEDCNYICAPSGGFTGKGDGNCTDFNSKSKFVRLVWKDERKSGRK